LITFSIAWWRQQEREGIKEKLREILELMLKHIERWLMASLSSKLKEGRTGTGYRIGEVSGGKRRKNLVVGRFY